MSAPNDTTQDISVDELKAIIRDKAFRIRQSILQVNPQFATYISHRDNLKRAFEALPGQSLPEKLYLVDNPTIETPTCPHCGKPLPFWNYQQGYRTYCAQRTCRWKDPSMWEKMRSTYAENHNGASYGSARSTIEKRRNTCVTTYGVEHHSQLPDQRLITSTDKRKKGYDILKDRCTAAGMELLFSEEEYYGVKGTYRFKCSTCGHIRETTAQYGKATLIKNVPRCFHCSPTITGTSVWESEVNQFLQSILPTTEIIAHSRSLIPPYEIDIHLPKYNFAIELNGNYWHSEVAGEKPKQYHQYKTTALRSLGIDLCQIFQDEWVEKRDILQAYLKARVGIWDAHIGARQCVFSEITPKQSREFLDHNHLQGFTGAAHHYGLWYESDLIAVMTFGKSRFSKTHDGELLRFAVKQNYKVPGAFSKLFKNAVNLTNYSTLVTYADARLFTGSTYASVGFTCKHLSNPNYFYLKPNDYFTREPRMTYQKHKLQTILDTFDPALTEWENMKLNKYDRIWDCGNYVWEWGRS